MVLDPAGFHFFQLGGVRSVLLQALDFGKRGGHHLVDIFRPGRQVDADRVVPVRDLAERAAGAAAVDHRHLFAQHLDDAQIGHFDQRRQAQLLGLREYRRAREVDRDTALGLGAAAYFALDHARHRAQAHVAVRHRQRGRGQGAQIARQQRTDRFFVEAAHQDERHVLRARETLAEDGDAAIEVDLGILVGLERAWRARVIAKQRRHHGVAEAPPRLAAGVARNLGLLVDIRVEQVFVAAHARELQPQQLQHRFDVGGARGARDDVGVAAQAHGHAGRLAGQDLAHVQRREILHAHAGHDRIGKARIQDVLIGKQALPAGARRAQHHLVIQEVGGFQDHLHAVRQRQARQAQRLVVLFVRDRAGLRRAFHQARCQQFFIVRFDRQARSLAHRRQQLRPGRRVGLGHARVQHQLARVLRDRAARIGVHFGLRDARHQVLHVAVFGLDAGNGFGLQEVADVFGGVGARIALGALVPGLLVGAHQVFLGAFEFLHAEAVLACAFVFLHQRCNRGLRAARADGGRRVIGAVARGQLAQRAAGAQPRCIGQLRDLGQARTEHRREQALHQLFAVGAHGAQVAHRLHRIADQHRIAIGFGVRHDQRLGVGARRNRGVLARARRGRILQAREVLLDELLGLRRIDVADHDDCHQVGPVPVLVEALERLGLEIAQHVFAADRQAFGVARAVEQARIDLLAHAVGGAFAQARFFEDDAALLVDGVSIEAHAVGPVFQHLEGAGDVLRFVGRNRQDVHGLVERGVGIQVGAEAHADRLQVRHQLVLAEIGRAIERHVLDEVRQAALVVVFQDRAGLDDQAQFELVFGARIALDVVGQAIGQLADLDLRADRDHGVELQRVHFRDGCLWRAGLRRTVRQRGHAHQRGQAGAAYEFVAHWGFPVT